jgi:hypothetical protein
LLIDRIRLLSRSSVEGLLQLLFIFFDLILVVYADDAFLEKGFKAAISFTHLFLFATFGLLGSLTSLQFHLDGYCEFPCAFLGYEICLDFCFCQVRLALHLIEQKV